MVNVKEILEPFLEKYVLEVETSNKNIEKEIQEIINLKKDFDIPENVLDIINKKLEVIEEDKELKEILKLRYILLFIKLYYLSRKSIVNAIKLLEGIINKELKEIKKGKLENFFSFY